LSRTPRELVNGFARRTARAPPPTRDCRLDVRLAETAASLLLVVSVAKQPLVGDRIFATARE